MSSRVGPLARWLGNRFRPVSPIFKRPPLVREALETSLVQIGTSGATYDNPGSVAMNSRANLSGRVQNGSVYYDGIDVYQIGVTSTNNAGSGFALGSTTSSHTVGSTQTIESRGGNSGSWYGSKLESGNSTTHYTTVSGTMGQPFSGMTQTGFNTTTLYGTAAQTGITGMYGYGQTGTGGSYNTLQTGSTIAPPDPSGMPVSPGRPSYQIAGGQSGSRPGVVSGFLTPVSGKVSGLPEKIKGPGNWGETLGGHQKKRYSDVDKAAVEALFREGNRFPARRPPKELGRMKLDTFDRYGPLTREPIGPPDLGLLDPSGAIIAIGETTLYLFDSIVILGEGGLTGLTYLFGGPENAYQHRYNPRSTVYRDLFSGKITTDQAILMVEMNYGVTVLAFSPLAGFGGVPKGAPVTSKGVDSYMQRLSDWAKPPANPANATNKNGPGSAFHRLEHLSFQRPAEINSLAADMKAKGWKGDPISVFEHGGEKYILDGHHRVAAARQAGIDIPFRSIPESDLSSFG